MVNESMKSQGHYLSYLLRLWRENGNDRPLWRASLEQPHTEHRQNFTSLRDLFTFLEQETGLASPVDLPSNEGDHPMSE